MKDFLEKSLFKTLLIVFALAQAEGRPGFVSGSAAPQGRALVRSPLEHTGWGGAGAAQHVGGRHSSGKGWESVALITREGQWLIHPCLDTFEVKPAGSWRPVGTHRTLFPKPVWPSLCLTSPLHPWSPRSQAPFPFHHLIVQT